MRRRSGSERTGPSFGTAALPNDRTGREGGTERPGAVAPSGDDSPLHLPHGRPRSSSEPLVSPVAERRGLGVLALAPPDGGLDSRLEFHRLHAGALVTAIAERRMTGPAAGAPPVYTSLHFQADRLVVADERFVSHARQLERAGAKNPAANCPQAVSLHGRHRAIVQIHRSHRLFFRCGKCRLGRYRHGALSELRVAVHGNVAEKSGE